MTIHEFVLAVINTLEDFKRTRAPEEVDEEAMWDEFEEYVRSNGLRKE